MTDYTQNRIVANVLFAFILAACVTQPATERSRVTTNYEQQCVAKHLVIEGGICPIEMAATCIDIRTQCRQWAMRQADEYCKYAYCGGPVVTGATQ